MSIFDKILKKHDSATPEHNTLEQSPKNEDLEGMSPERLAAVQELEGEIKEITSLNEGDLVEEISDPEKRKELADKLDVLAKVGETLKDYWPAIVTGVASLASLAVAMKFSADGGDLANSAVMSTQKIGAMVASAAAVLAGALSTGIATWKSHFKENPQVE